MGKHIVNVFGSIHERDYLKRHPWSEKRGMDLRTAAFKWGQKGKKIGVFEGDAKPEGYMTQEDYKTQVSDLNQQIEQLKIDQTPKVAQPGEPTSPSVRDIHGGYGGQSEFGELVETAKKQSAGTQGQQTSTTSKKKATAKPNKPIPLNTYSGTATL